MCMHAVCVRVVFLLVVMVAVMEAFFPDRGGSGSIEIESMVAISSLSPAEMEERKGGGGGGGRGEEGK